MSKEPIHFERFPNPATTDPVQFTEARRAFPALLKAIDAEAGKQGWDIHDQLYGPFRALCATVLQINRYFKILRYVQNGREARVTLDHIQTARQHLAETILKTQGILSRHSAVIDLHRQIVEQALIVQSQFPPDLIR
ncbi:MAG: hypothetical protein ACD_41C00262G0001 [uncultured bacterium]|nr:MAG: hypothetical protein ACD_41C00262G0001 [uncultured bacterium]